MQKTIRTVLFVFALLAYLPACTLLPGENVQVDPTVRLPDQITSQSTGADGLSAEKRLYAQAQEAARLSNFPVMISVLQELESRFPFGRYAEQAQLEIIYAHYQSLNFGAAKAAADRFIRLYPNNPQVDYAYYLKGIIAFTEDRGLFERFLPTDREKRDPGAARESFSDFAQLLARFPNSQYAPDARKRMIYLRNLLAGYEINVGRYYIKREAYIAALNRGRFVVENFQQTPAVADGLSLIIQASLGLGLIDAADNSLKVLLLNYPNHSTIDSQCRFVIRESELEAQRSLTNIFSFGFFDKPAVQQDLIHAISDDVVASIREQVIKNNVSGKSLGCFETNNGSTTAAVE